MERAGISVELLNQPIEGRIYHVVDKATGEIVKVGSTIQTLEKRFRGKDYQKKYQNHFLREVRCLKSSDIDWFQPKNLLCPFMWHLVAAEELEIVRVGTFRKSRLSNQMSPLKQKLSGLGGEYGSVGGRIGGLVSGNNAVRNKTGIHAVGFDRSYVGRIKTPAKTAARFANLEKARLALTPEMKRELGLRIGRRNSKSGWIKGLGKAQGRKNVDSGHLARISHLGASLGATTRNHNQYHVLRGVVSTNCMLCKEN
jgi:hypothetical protein